MPSETEFIKAVKQPKCYSTEERKAYVTQWEQSQLSRSEFCQREGLILKNFYAWVKKHAVEPPKQSKPGLSFIPLKTNHEMRAHAGSPIEIYLPNGLRCYFRSEIDTQTLVRIVKGLMYVTHS